MYDTVGTPSVKSEQQEFHFGKIGFPSEIADFLRDEQITGKDMLLLAAVDALSRNSDIGCWANNAYLAKACNCAKGHVTNALAKLEQLGVIIREFTRNPDGTTLRQLWTPWTKWKRGEKPKTPSTERCEPHHQTVDTPSTERCAPSLLSIREDEGKENNPPGGGSAADAAERLPREGEWEPLLFSALNPAVEEATPRPLKRRKKDAARPAPGADAPSPSQGTVTTTHRNQATTPPGRQNTVEDSPHPARTPGTPLATLQGARKRGTISGADAPEPCRDAAKKLYDCLAAKHKITPTVKPTLWASVLAKFRPGIGPKRFDAVLEWYCEHIGERYVPLAWCAKAFCDKFLHIEAAMQRSTGEEIDDAPAIVEVPEEDRWVLELVEDGGTWPKGSRRHLPGVVVASLEHYREFWSKLSKLCKRYGVRRGLADEDTELCEFGQFLKAFLDASYGPEDFVIEWFREVGRHETVRPGFNGTLKPFNVKSKKFRNFGRDVSEHWDASDKNWDRLMGELGYDD